MNKRFEILNPWWKSKEFIEQDKEIKEYNKKKFKWKPDLLEELKKITLIEGESPEISSIRGPRQVGKTTIVKLLIRYLLLERKEEGKSIFYYSCDEIIDFRELASIIREYLDIAKQFNVKKKYLFIDEISSVKKWQKAIKSLVDSNELRECILFFTGSHMLDIKLGTERLPGRTGRKGKDFLLLPMSFRDFIELVKPEIGKGIPKIKRFSMQEINKKIKIANFYDNELKILFNQYLISGGFPLTINEFLTNKDIPDYVYDIYLRWIIGDITRWGKQEKILNQIMSAIISKQGSQVSLDSLAKEAEVKSHKTISSYLEILENMFVLIVLYYLELNKKIPDFNKNKKVYFFDPFLFHLFNKIINLQKSEVTPQLIEACAINNLTRIKSPFKPNIFYWKNKREVDAILKLEKDIFPFEIKYQTKISGDDWRGLYYFKKGVMLTKSFFKTGDKYTACPLHIFLSVL